MSVINTMLKDLERRGAGNSTSGDKILGGLSSSGNVNLDDEPSSKIYWLSLASVIAVVIVIGSVYYLSPYQLVSVAQSDVNLTTEQHSQLAQEIQASPIVTAPVVAKPLVLESVATELAATQAAASVSVGDSVSDPVEDTGDAALIQQPPVIVSPVAAAIHADTDVIERKSSTTTPTRKEPIAVKPAPIIKPAMIESQLEDADSEEDTAASMLVVTKQQREFTAEEKSQQAYSTAMTMYKQGRKQEAKSSLTEAISFSSINPDAYRMLAVIYLEDGRADLASEVVVKGLSTHINDQSLLRLHLQSLVQLGKYKEAIVIMEQRLNLTTPDDLAYLAGLYQKNSDHLNAVKLYAQALQLIPSKSVWWMGQGISFEVMAQYKEAMMSYEKSISTGQLTGKLAEYAISRMSLIKQHHAGSVS